MLKLNLALFISTATMLFYVIRYRIHVTVSYTPRRSRRVSRSIASGVGQVAPVDSGEDAGVTRDLESALINLGASGKEARERASAAIAQGPGDFDALILRAMQAGGEPQHRRSRR
jgi:hypothetical protein